MEGWNIEDWNNGILEDWNIGEAKTFYWKNRRLE